MTTFHRGEWEKDLGYSQSVRVGNWIVLSGVAGDESRSKDLASQLADAYQFIEMTLAHDGATLKNVIRERVYCTDIEQLKAATELRKSFYKGHLPASTWVEVARLYTPGLFVEIEVEAVLE